MLLWWPHSEPDGGVDLVVTRALEVGDRHFEVGAALPYRELGFGYEQARVLCRDGFTRLERLQMVAVRAFDGFAAGDVVPFIEMGLDQVRIAGMVSTNLVRLELAEPAPAPKVGGKIDRGAAARQRSARA